MLSQSKTLGDGEAQEAWHAAIFMGSQRVGQFSNWKTTNNALKMQDSYSSHLGGFFPLKLLFLSAVKISLKFQLNSDSTKVKL